MSAAFAAAFDVTGGETTLPGFPSVSTRIIYGQWVYTDGTAVETAPTISYPDDPYFISTQAMVFAKPVTATFGTAVNGETTGVWTAEVLVYDDPDLVGNVQVEISHDLLPGGRVVIGVPAGTEPFNVAEAISVVLG